MRLVWLKIDHLLVARYGINIFGNAHGTTSVPFWSCFNRVFCNSWLL